ncbi:hypothetical protein C8Q80DRAFT_1358702, partial [Daedaleopsis nitida]
MHIVCGFPPRIIMVAENGAIVVDAPQRTSERYIQTTLRVHAPRSETSGPGTQLDQARCLRGLSRPTPACRLALCRKDSRLVPQRDLHSTGSLSLAVHPQWHRRARRHRVAHRSHIRRDILSPGRDPLLRVDPPSSLDLARPRDEPEERHIFCERYLMTILCTQSSAGLTDCWLLFFPLATVAVESNVPRR